jgi:hypothetical protein
LEIKKAKILTLIIFQIIIIFLFVSCSNSSFRTYENENLQYTIDYPESWSVQTIPDPLAVEPAVVLMAPSPNIGQVGISVIEDSKSSPQQVAGGTEITLERILEGFTITVEQGKTELWDWHFEGRGTTDKGDIYAFGYYKQKANYLYKIQGMVDAKIWDDLIIDKIISSFKLL